jgi:hypothetical protein
MLRVLFQVCLCTGFLLPCLPGDAFGQEFILPYLKPPETPREFWAATKFEL